MVDKKDEKNLQYALYALIALGVLFFGYALASSGVLSGIFKGQPPSASPTPNPALPQIKISVITLAGCKYCYDITMVSKAIKQDPSVNVVSEETFSLENASALIAQYGITKVPTILVSGETQKLAGLQGQFWPALKSVSKVEPDGTWVLTAVPPLYFDLQKKDFVGKLKLTSVVNTTCFQCTRAYVLQGNFQAQTGINFTEEEVVPFNSTSGQKLVAQYNITKIPALIITGEIGVYNGLNESWTKIGTIEKDGALVWRMIPPVYQELPSLKLKGLVSLTELADPSCKNCYNLAIHEKALGQLGVQIKSITILNYTQPEAKKLIQQYGITFVPTALVSSEVSEYYPFSPGLQPTINQVFTTEPDGQLLFTNLTALAGNATFRNLTSGNIETNNKTG